MTPMTFRVRPYLVLLLLALVTGGGQVGAAVPGVGPLPTRNIILITYDGLRHQEVFTGAEALLMNKTNGGVRD